MNDNDDHGGSAGGSLDACCQQATDSIGIDTEDPEPSKAKSDKWPCFVSEPFFYSSMT
jgi:hypothetical protein